jgi:hypothetical protein
METIPILPPGVRPESTQAIPPHDSHFPAEALREAPSAFNPSDWLHRFENVGGGWIVRDCLSLVIQVEDRSDADLSAARELVASLTPADRTALVAHLRSAVGRV